MGALAGLTVLDLATFVAAPFCSALLAEFGAEEVRAYNHDLAWQAGERLARRWGTEFRTPRSMVASMVSVPLPARCGGTAAEAALLRDRLLFEDRIEIHIAAREGRLAARVAIQIYNDLAELMTLEAEGKVKLHTSSYPLDAANDAMDDLDQGRLHGRGILIP